MDILFWRESLGCSNLNSGMSVIQEGRYSSFLNEDVMNLVEHRPILSSPRSFLDPSLLDWFKVWVGRRNSCEQQKICRILAFDTVAMVVCISDPIRTPVLGFMKTRRCEGWGSRAPASLSGCSEFESRLSWMLVLVLCLSPHGELITCTRLNVVIMKLSSKTMSYTPLRSEQ